jgi:nitrous oxidase accessory protein NosD
VTGIQLTGSIGSEEVNANIVVGTTIGIDIKNGTGNRILNNDLTGSIRTALMVRDDTQAKVSGNVFTGSRTGIDLRAFNNVVVAPTTSAPTLPAGQTWFRADVDLSQVTEIAMLLVDAQNVTVEGLDLSYAQGNNSGTGLYLQSGSENIVSGVKVSGRSSGILLQNETAPSVHCSEIVSNSNGISVSGTASGTVVSQNHFEGNSSAIKNFGSSLVDAKSNYWGASDGPSNLGGSGDSYFGNVDAGSFLTSLPDCLRTNLPPEVTVDAAAISFDEGSTAVN